MQLRTLGATVSALALVALTACGGDADEPDTAASPEPTVSSSPTATESPEPEPEPEPDPEPEPADPGITITTDSSNFGTMLFDAADQAIYIWEREPTSTPECYGDCAVAWPPVLTDGEPVAEGQVRDDLLGTVERTDGTTQVTYNDHPLYYYVDEGPGEVRCHNVRTHGGLWWVIQPDGNRAP